ncbi:hypothetical protein DXG03_003824 [Asterophora parasitica]|uniref:Uncharacterized protein n=1 Tax=Asterophora parasitica TaxID=117018 RepID=A0A9P7G765_9AGAR|nr:hypothetical protein DXG03_003824 [Asterophora parasitica]
MSDAECPIMLPPMFSPEEQLASLESLMSTLLSTSQSTAMALTCILIDLTLLTALIPATPAVVQATTATTPLPTDLANLPAFLESYKVQAATDVKAEAEAQLHPTVNSTATKTSFWK